MTYLKQIRLENNLTRKEMVIIGAGCLKWKKNRRN